MCSTVGICGARLKKKKKMYPAPAQIADLTHISCQLSRSIRVEALQKERRAGFNSRKLDFHRGARLLSIGGDG